MKPSALAPLMAALLVAGPALAQGTPDAKPATADQEKEKPKVYAVGTQVPADLTLHDLDGKKLTMKELRGKTVVITWYAYKCPAIVKAEPELIESGELWRVTTLVAEGPKAMRGARGHYELRLDGDTATLAGAEAL